jgi:hypothetical protein
MGEWQRFVENLFARLSGPLHFRIIVQPLMATIFAAIDGLKDAKAGRPTYFWELLSTPQDRRELVQEGWKSVGKIFILAIILDVVYQLKFIRGFIGGKLFSLRLHWQLCRSSCCVVRSIGSCGFEKK